MDPPRVGKRISLNRRREGGKQERHG
jgi:hypothetical protein